MNEFSDIRLVTDRELSKAMGVSVKTLEKMEAKGLLPPRTRISPRKSGWFGRTLRTFLDTEAA